MQPTTRGLANDVSRPETRAQAGSDLGLHWPVNWSAVWVGALAASTAVLIFGLIGVALGAHMVAPGNRVVELKSIAFMTLAYSIFSAFLAFVIGGWAAGKVLGVGRSEPSMLHGAISWLLSIPILIGLASLGAGSVLGGWYAGVSSPGWTRADEPFARPDAPGAGASETELSEYRENMKAYREKMAQWQEDTPRATRNAALGTLTALLLGLMGSVVGGWMASGEPMSPRYRRRAAV